MEKNNNYNNSSNSSVFGRWLQAETFCLFDKNGQLLDFQILVLPDADGHPQEVYLDRRKLIPVPLYFWKIVHDDVDNAAVVFVGINSPEETDDLPAEYQLCPDICESAKWNFPQKGSSDRGFLYCCSYQSFKKSIPWIDFLDNPALLVNHPVTHDDNPDPEPTSEILEF